MPPSHPISPLNLLDKEEEAIPPSRTSNMMILWKELRVCSFLHSFLIGCRYDVDAPLSSCSGKSNRRVIIPSIDRLRKKSIRCVPDDGLNICCGKAILLAIEEVEKDVDLRSLRRKDCSLLQRRVIALHQKTDVPQEPCIFEEIAFCINVGNAAKSALNINIDVGKKMSQLQEDSCRKPNVLPSERICEEV
ncbi:uncharacterized protein TNCV_493281 [Trichonephila clavipes]|nr:uncharacterized protein TNCV_493281 [Trichonephila clavipes]